MKMLIGLFVLFLCVPLVADFEKKCSVLITLRFQSNEDAYKDALTKIKQCEKNPWVYTTFSSFATDYSCSGDRF